MRSDALLDTIETAAFEAAPDAASAVRAALEAVRAHLPPALELVAGPGLRPVGGVHRDDILVKLSPGEPVPPRVDRIVTMPVWAGGFQVGQLEDDLGLPGWVSAVSPVAVPGAPLRVRQVLDGVGCLPANTALFRAR